MKTLKLIFVFVLLTGLGAVCHARSYNEKIADAMNSGDWFALDSLHRSAPQDSVMPMLEVFSRCLTGNRFNRPDISVPAFDELFNSYASELGLGNLLSSTVMFAADLSRIGYNDRASELMQAIRTSTDEYLDSTWRAALDQGAARYKALSAYKPYGVTFREDMGRIPFVIVPVGEAKKGSVLMHLENSRINGHEADITFDTGAGVNMICDSLAAEYGLIPIDGYITVAGVGSREGRFAIARELEIGNMTVTDVPFVIMNFETGNAEADKFIDKFNVIAGSELMLRLKDVTVDFVRKEITVPAEAPVRGDAVPDMCFGEGMGLCVKGSVLDTPMLMNIDTGDASYGYLGSEFFRLHKEYIVNEAKPDTVRRGGLGGVDESICYRVPRMPVSMGGHTVGVPHMEVYAQDMSSVMAFSCNIGLTALMMFDKIRFNLVDFVFTTYPRNLTSFYRPHGEIKPFNFKNSNGPTLFQALGMVAVGVARGLINPNAPANPDL